MSDPAAATTQVVLLSVPEAAAACGLPEATVRGWVADGAVTTLPFGRARMVNVAEVAAVRDRRAPGTGHPIAPVVPASRRPTRRRVLLALALADVAVGLAGALALLGIGPTPPGGPWWPALCLAALLVGLLLWRAAALPGGPRRRSPH